jgi:hypothetical protein
MFCFLILRNIIGDQLGERGEIILWMRSSQVVKASGCQCQSRRQISSMMNLVCVLVVKFLPPTLVIAVESIFGRFHVNPHNLDLESNMEQASFVSQIINESNCWLFYLLIILWADVKAWPPAPSFSSTKMVPWNSPSDKGSNTCGTEHPLKYPIPDGGGGVVPWQGTCTGLFTASVSKVYKSRATFYSETVGLKSSESRPERSSSQSTVEETMCTFQPWVGQFLLAG